MFRYFLSVSLLAVCGWPQLIPAGTPLPRTPNLPVVFINGFQDVCPGSFASTFGMADQVLQANGEASVFFDTCVLPKTASIEDLGAAFGRFLAGLKYQDGQPVDRVDIVAHSMGGLVLRSYLSGKQTATGKFNPPANTHVRKAVFLATPHFGTPLAALAGVTTILQELASGSQFLFDLATWNQGTDDLRGVDAIAAIGNAGSGLAVMKGFDDGVAALTSASLRFYMPGRTRVLPYCHVGTGGLLGFAQLCLSDATGIANIRAASDPIAQLITSFFNGTTAWQSVGTAAEDDPFLSVGGGLDIEGHGSDDSTLKLNRASALSTTASKQLNIESDVVAYTDLFPAGQVTLTTMTAAAGTVSNTVSLGRGGTQPFVVKPGPQISRVLPAASNVFPLSVAPGMFVAVYGSSLASGTAQAGGIPFPTQLSDAQALINGNPIPIEYASSNQINAVIPESAGGLVQLTVRNGSGSRTVNLLVEAAVPAIFTLDSSGSGAAAALSASNGQVVSASNPLRAGDYVELFATGLGQTASRGGLDHTVQQPTVTIGGKDCSVTFAGRAPGYVGLDQINCVLPPGLDANPSTAVVITSGARTSNVATLAVD